MRKKVAVDTDVRKGQLFEVSDSNGTFYVYEGAGWNRYEIGRARSLDDAIVIIKSKAKGTVRNIRIS